MGTNLRKPEFILIRRGDVAEKMYFVARGEVSIHTLDSHFVENQTSIIKPGNVGNYLGEVALVMGCRRTATAITRNYCTIAKLKKIDFDEMLERFPSARVGFMKYINTYSDEYHEYAKSLIRSIPYFFKLNDADISSLAF